MSEAAPNPTDAFASPPPRSRARLRLFLLAGVVALWLMDWMRVQIDQGQAVLATGAEYAGPVAATTLLILFGLSATTFLSHTLRGLRTGHALSDAAMAAVMAWLMAGEHPWMPGGEIRTLWAAIFAPLAAMALLDAGMQRFAKRAGPELAALRAGTAFFAAGVLFVDSAFVPAGMALYLSISALLAARTKRPLSVRRGIEGLLLLCALAHGASPTIQRHIQPVGLQTEPPYLWFWLWGICTVLVVLSALDGLMRPEGELDYLHAS